jgi:hypothetical protein
MYEYESAVQVGLTHEKIRILVENIKKMSPLISKSELITIFFQSYGKLIRWHCKFML